MVNVPGACSKIPQKKMVKKAKKVSDITEDDFDDLEKEIQDTTNEHTKTIDEMVKGKEEEILEV